MLIILRYINKIAGPGILNLVSQLVGTVPLSLLVTQYDKQCERHIYISVILCLYGIIDQNRVIALLAYSITLCSVAVNDSL